MEPKHDSCGKKFSSLSATLVAQNLKTDTQNFYTMDNTRHHYQCRINELHGRRIEACFHGWVVLSNHPDSVLWSLWNPLTSRLIRLPPLTHREKDSYGCCLTSPPDDQGSVFLLLPDKVFTIVFCRLDCKRKKLKWIEMSYAKQLRTISGEDDCFLQCLTCCNGKVYAMASTSYRFVIQIDINVVKGKEVVISLVPFVEIPPTSRHLCPSRNGECTGYLFLEGSAIDLFSIGVRIYIEGTIKTISDVRLYKLDMTSMTWKETMDLEDATFFLEISDDCSACYYSSVVESKLGGYIHVLNGSSKIIYSFHTKDKTMSLSSMSSLVRENHDFAWAMLDWRSEVDLSESKQKEEDKDAKIVIRPVENDNVVFDSTTNESHLLNLPTHILELIMEFCIGVEYMKFRATCKHCYLAAPLIQWSSDTGLRRLRSYSLVSPWLMVLDSYRDTITFIDPLCGERYFIKTPEQLRDGYQIYCSRYGWLLMYKYEDESRPVFFNPLTSNILELPVVVGYLESFCFSAPPTSPDCKVFGFTSYGQWNVFFLSVSRDSRWRVCGLNFANGDPYSFQFPTFSGRDIYALCKNESIEAFSDIADDDFSWMFNVGDKVPRRSHAQYYLSSCDQHLLLLVIVGEFGETVEVFKLDESTTEWVKIDGLGRHMIYISDTSCICLEAKLPEMENKIYFPRLLHDDDTKIVFYSLETCRYHTFNDKNIQESLGVDLLGTKHHCYPHTWIEPSWS